MFADKILGLGLDKVKKIKATGGVERLLKEREALREAKKWDEADKIRAKILELGYIIEDSSAGPKLKKSTLEGRQA